MQETAGDEDPPNRVTLNIGGDLGGTKLAHCVASAFETASGRFTVPPISDGATWFGDLAFPFDPSTVEAKLTRLRAMSQEQKGPSF